MSNFTLDLGDSARSSYLGGNAQPPEMPQTKNVVATLDVLCRLDLKEIVTKSRNSEYNPKRFAAVIMRIREPKSTALIFSSGKLVITGAKTVADALISTRKYVRILQKLEFPAKWGQWKIVNVVGCCGLGFPVRLESLAHFNSSCCSYEPELFPGLIYRVKKPKVTMLIFVSGKIIVTGAKSKDEIDNSFKKVWPILLKFKKEHHIADSDRTNELNDEQNIDFDDDMDEDHGDEFYE